MNVNARDYKSTQAGRWDFYYRAERNKASGVHPRDTEPKLAQAEFPVGTSLAFALEYMWAERQMPRGSARAGCYEVQTPDGVFSQVNDAKIDLTTPRKAANVVFQSYDL